ncbi:hypothetical protein K7X08_016711 [Anisodus acutangulus]|uniref:Uncharacterized protein n=1 Tax=Anisodus acutangulus TaxID=402998 RepID=A0A9Q1LFR2_9SOLA|nr:hypothetical protein K7X08_016711 [Anisodus acutangulus]
MYFSGRETPYPSLEIMYKKQNSCAKILTLKVHPPVIGAFLLVRMLLETSLHLPEWLTTKTKDIMDNFSGKVMTAEVPLLRSSSHQNVVIASSASRDESFSSWRVPPSGFGEGKSSHSSKSKATLNNPPQKVKATSKSNFDGKDTQVEIKVRYPSLTLKAAATSSEAINISHKSKGPSRSSDKGVEESPSVVSLCMDKTKASVSPNEVGITSATSSSNESNISQEQHWKRLKKKPKDLDDQNNEFVYLDSISIDTAIFGDGAAGSTMPLTKYAQQKHGDYDVVRSSTSQKMNRDSHQELLSAAQRLHTATEEKIKRNKRLGELQIILAKTEKELEVLTTKKKKTTSFIDEHQKKLFRNQESITATEDEIHTIEETSPLSEDWFKPFP